MDAVSWPRDELAVRREMHRVRATSDFLEGDSKDGWFWSMAYLFACIRVQADAMRLSRGVSEVRPGSPAVLPIAWTVREVLH